MDTRLPSPQGRRSGQCRLLVSARGKNYAKIIPRKRVGRDRKRNPEINLPEHINTYAPKHISIRPPVLMITLRAFILSQGHAHTVCSFQPAKQSCIQIFRDLLMLPASDKVMHFIGILLQVVQFVDIPNAVIPNELVAVGAYRVDRGRLRERSLPEILIVDRVCPFSLLSP